MKLINIGMALFMMSVTQSAFAAEQARTERAQQYNVDPLQLELTSFRLTNPAPDRTAELCGRVLGRFNGAHRINVTVDPGQNSGTYVTFPGADGRFCVLVNTLIGRVQAFIWDGSTLPEGQSPLAVEARLR